ncbi:MAG TPA: cupin domain-containing protein [Gaiellaceae bacterium]|nr:cupin domain-containing protein [Gaiellaceae bacterium]
MELDVAQPVLLTPGEDEGEAVVDQPRRTLRILFSHELLDVTWTRHEGGERGAEPHVHREHADAFYVLEGELTFRVGPELERVTAAAGTFVAVPPNVVHGFDNDSSERACFLNFHSPSTGFADYLRGSGRFDSFDPPADGGRPAAEAIVSPPGAGERVRSHRVKAELPHLSAIELAFEPGWEGVDPHVHSDHVDSFFVLEGAADFLGGRAGPGTFVAAAPCVVHGFQIAEGCDRLAIFNVHAPDSGFAGRLRRR